MVYTKLPIGFMVEPLSPGVVVERKTIVDVFIGVRWMCTVVCGVFGSGKDSSMGFNDGLAESDKGGGWFDMVVAILRLYICRSSMLMFLGKIVNGNYAEAVFLLDSVYSVIISTVVIELEAPLDCVEC
jgi:hypothetical protein